MKNDYVPFYIKYKAYLLPVGLAFLSIFILSRVIMPQLSAIGDKSQEISQKEEEIATLNRTLNVLNSQDPEVLASDLSVATDALPTAKSIASVFDAMSSAATASNAQLSEFTLKLGGVYGTAAKSVQTSSRGTPQVEVLARISSAGPQEVARFTKEIQQRIPLSEVKTIDATGNSATIAINFFYKPIDLSAVSNQDAVPNLSQSDLNLLNQLKEWRDK